MRSDLIVLPEPGIDCDLSLFGGVKAWPVGGHGARSRACVGLEA